MGKAFSGEVEFLVKDLGGQRPKVGQILLRQLGDGSIVAHRCILITRRYGALRYYLKGDNNRRVDPSIVAGKETVGLAIRVRINGKDRSLMTLAARLRGRMVAMGNLTLSLLRKLRYGHTG